MRTVVGFAGPIGAGKTTGAKYVAKRYGFAYVRYSEVLADWTSLLTRSGLQAAGWAIMSSGLQEELNRRVIAAIPRNSSCAVDGLRHPMDRDMLSETFGPSFFLLYVNAPRQIRCQRAVESNRFSDPAAFWKADAHPVERPLRTLRWSATATIDNIGSTSKYEAALDKALREIGLTSGGGAQ